MIDSPPIRQLLPPIMSPEQTRAEIRKAVAEAERGEFLSEQEN